MDNKNSTYVGRHIIRDGDRPQRFARAADPMFEFYHLNNKMFDDCEIDVNKHINMIGCFKSNKVTLQRTMIPDFEEDMEFLPTMEKVKSFRKAVRSAIRKLKITELAKAEKEDMLLTSFNSKTFPGFSYKNYFGLNTKEEASNIALDVANKRWDVITDCSKKKIKLKRNKIFPYTYTVGARNKREYFYEDDEVMSSRAVHMPEFHGELNSSIWTEQISQSIKLKGRGPIYLGNSIVRFERLIKDAEGSSFCVEGDWKRFDSRLYITNIIIGLSILRLYFDHNDKEIDYHFLAIFDTIGIKDYYTPGGYIYRMIHGLPSGVCLTSLLGSIINFVNLLFCTKDYDHKKIKFVVGGDDFLIFFDKSIKKDGALNKIEENATKIGQVFKILEIKSFKKKDIFSRPSFFKYTIDRNEALVYPTALLERVFLPWNKNYKDNIEIFTFLRDLIPSLGAPRSTHIPFYYFYKEMYQRVFKRDVNVVDIFEEHSNIYKKVLLGQKYYRKDDIIYYKNFQICKNAYRGFSNPYFFRLGNTKIRSLKVRFRLIPPL